MIDIVNGLRRIAEEGYRFAGDAADEIERLRADKATLQQMVYSLKDRIETAEKERAIDEQRIADLMAELNRVGHENEALWWSDRCRKEPLV